MEKVEVKFGEWIEEGFNLYKANFGPLVLASLLAILLGSVSFGILTGPMMAGLVLVTLEILDKKQPQPSGGEVFRGFDYFLNSFLFFLVWGLIIGFAIAILTLVLCIGLVLAAPIIYVAQTFLMFGLFLIVDRKMDFWPASMESIDTVKNNFWPLLGLSVVAALIGGIGGIACGIGIIFTFPIQICILAVAYRKVYNGIRASGSPEQPPPIPPAGTPPPGQPTHPQ
jgi:uncharacterized membrane protein